MTATSSPAEPPEPTLAAVLAAHLLTLYPGTVDCGCGAEFSTVDPDDDDALIGWWCDHATAILAATPTAAHVETDECACPPCPGRGDDGHGMRHCAECCFGSGVEADPYCPVHGETAAHVAQLEAALAAAEARLRAVEALADEWDSLDMGTGLYPEDSAHRSAHEDRAEACADEVRAALTPPP